MQGPQTQGHQMQTAAVELAVRMVAAAVAARNVAVATWTPNSCPGSTEPASESTLRGRPQTQSEQLQVQHLHRLQ